MICSNCGGYVEWKGPLSNLTHTECSQCGAMNSQIAEDDEHNESPETELNELRGELAQLHRIFKRYFLAVQAYHQSPHDLRVHEQYTVARTAAVKALGLTDG